MITNINSDNLELATANLESKKRKLIQLAQKTDPDIYLTSYDYGSLRDEIESETLEAAYNLFDAAIRSGAKFALLRALYMAEDASGEIYINLGIHEI